MKVLKVVLKRQAFILSIWSLGAITGASAVYWVETLPKLQESAIFEQIQPIETVQAKELPKVDEIDEMAELIYQRESSKGKNNFSKCEEQGKYNGIGYAIPGDGTYICFESHEEEMQALKGWLVAKKAAGMSDDEMLCLYSGNNYVNCKK